MAEASHEHWDGRDPAMRSALQADHDAFVGLAEPFRSELQAHCYRMLGSLTDAEDLVQETLLRAWKSRHTYAGRAPFRAWLYRIATNACLDELAARPKRGLPSSFSGPADPAEAPRPPLADPVWLHPFPDRLLPAWGSSPDARYDQRESIRLAFLVALHELAPRQRAVLLLRDVLGWKPGEVAELLDLSVPAVNTALYRARVRLSARAQLQDVARPADENDPAERQLLERYLRAWETADIDQLTRLLKEDASFPMPPLPGWYRGRADIRAFLEGAILSGEARGRWRLLPSRANDRPAFAFYQRVEGGPVYAAFAIQVITIDRGLVADATTFGFPQLFPIFGLAKTIPGQAGP